MSVMVDEAPVWTGASIPSPPVRQTSRSTMDQFKERNRILVSGKAESPAARILYDSWARDLPSDAHFGEIVGVNTSPDIHHYVPSTGRADRGAFVRPTNRAILTRLRDYADVALHMTDMMTPSPELHSRESRVDPDLKRSLGRLNYIRTLPDGWLGDDSVGSSEDTGSQAEKLLRRLRAEAPSAPLPVLGLDVDGTIVMSWSAGGLTGSMTIYGDGTYSYFVRRGDLVARDPKATISEPIAEALRRLLAA